MESWQKLFIILWGITSLLMFIKGFRECKDKKNAFGLTSYFTILGAFVWGDAVIFGIFWTLVSLVTLLLNDWILFLLIVSVFWVVRGFGETIYWLDQQFSSVKRNPPENFWFHKYFHNDSVWFIHQIISQCITVTSIIFTIYFTHLWLS